MAKVASKKVTVRKKSTEIAKSVEERLAMRVRTQQENTEVDNSNLIRVKRTGFEYQGLDMGMSLHVVVLGSVFENVYYDSAYDPTATEIKDPLCFAFNAVSKDIAPPAELTTAVNKTCAGCPFNEFGSAAMGKGKACRNYRRVAVVPWRLEDDTADLSEIGIIRIAPTGLQSYSKYVNKIVTMEGKDPVQFITKFSVDESSDYPKIRQPEVVDEITDKELLGGLLSLPFEKVLADHTYNLNPTPSAPVKPKTPRARSRV